MTINKEPGIKPIPVEVLVLNHFSNVSEQPAPESPIYKKLLHIKYMVFY